MTGSPQRRASPTAYGRVIPAILLSFLSLIPFVLPMADAIPETTKPAAPAKPAREHARVVLMIIDGLGARKATEPGLMPHLQSRIKTSAFGIALASFPTITPTGLRAILGGHRMVAEPELPTGMRSPVEIDSVMRRAVEGGLKVFVVGQFTWPVLFPGIHGANFTEIHYRGTSIRYGHGPLEANEHYDEEIFGAVEPILLGKKGPWDFVAMHLFESDPVAHGIGTENSVYNTHLRWLDRKIEVLSRETQDLYPVTFLLTADHGQAEDGTHGGLTDKERQAPFLLWGTNIRKADFGVFPLYNAAPTITALLGVRPPAMTEGWPMLEGMLMTPRQKADILRDLLDNRLARWDALRTAWPWLIEDPQPSVDRLQRLYAVKEYDLMAAETERYIRAVDKSIEDGIPKKWLWRVVMSAWCLVFAACFGLAWHDAAPRIGRIIAVLGVLVIAALALPIRYPGLWGNASMVVLGLSAAIAALAALQGFASKAGPERMEWIIWWIALAGISFQGILDISLWSWILLLGLFLSRALHLKKENRASSAIAFLAAGICLLLTSGLHSPDYSLIRSFLPTLHLSLFEKPNWKLVEILILTFVLGAGYFPFSRSEAAVKARLHYALAVMPLLTSWALMRFAPAQGTWTFLACFISIAALVVLRPPPELRGFWLSAVVCAYFRAMSNDSQWCFLALAVTVGWSLAWKTRDSNAIWEGLGLLGLGLWSYRFRGGDLSFSHLTVSEGHGLLGAGWHPRLLALLVTLKQISAIGAPILPRLYHRPLDSVLGTFPLLGALSAGNLFMLWWDRYMAASNIKLTDDLGYTRVIFVLVLAWLILGLRMFVQCLDGLSAWMATEPLAQPSTTSEIHP